MRKLTILLSTIVLGVLIAKYARVSLTNSQPSLTTNTSTPLSPRSINTITLDKESQLLFKLRTTPVSSKTVQNSFVIPAATKMLPQSKTTVSSAITGLLKMNRILGIGDRVKKGDILAIVEQPLSVPDQITLDAYKIEQKTRRIKTEDEVEHTHKLLTIAELELSRAKKLYEAGAISLKKLQEAEQKVDFATVETNHAMRNLIDLGEKDNAFENSITIKSPLTGVVTSIEATNGQQIETGKTLLTIVDLSTVLIEAQLFEADIPKLYNATSINYRIPAIDSKAYKIAINKNKPSFTLSTTINPATRTLAVYFEIPNIENKLLDGLVVELELNNEDSKENLALPLQAIIEENGQQFVFVHKGGEQFEKRAVKLGKQNKTDVEILSGLILGERVVIEGLYQLKAKK